MNHYDTLGISNTASQDEIKKAYRKLAMQYHPDKGGDPSKFQEINNAYEVLGDQAKRAEYDNPAPQYSNHPGGFSFNVNGFDIDSMFSQIFGQQNARQHQQKPTFRTRVSVSTVDSYNGAEHFLQVSTNSGTKLITIKVPKGVDTGNQIRYDNVLDNAALIVEFYVIPDLRFDRRGHDLYVNLPISVLDLITGTTVEVDTISGKKLEVSISPKTQPHQQIRIPGYGMPITDGVYGDQILLLKSYIPDIISNDVIDAIKNSTQNTETN